MDVQESLDNIEREIQQRSRHWQTIIDRQAEASTLTINNMAGMAVQSIALADADFDRWLRYQNLRSDI